MNTKSAFAPVPNRLGLYPVVDSLAWLVRMLDIGVTTVQLRIKDSSKAHLMADIEAAVLLGRRYDAKVFINDYWQLAIHYNAYGVHMGQQDMDSADIGAIRTSGLRLGLSTHDDAELSRALTWQPSYISFGHIFPTNTKVMLSQPLGLETLRRLVADIPSIPTVAIGGIGLEQVEAVLACGVGSIAVVSAITRSPYWRKATADLQQRIAAWEYNHEQ